MTFERDLEHRQNEFEHSRDGIDRDSPCDDAVSVDENDPTTPLTCRGAPTGRTGGVDTPISGRTHGAHR